MNKALAILSLAVLSIFLSNFVNSQINYSDNNSLNQESLNPALITYCLAFYASGGSVSCGYTKFFAERPGINENLGIYKGIIPGMNEKDSSGNLAVQILFNEDPNAGCSEAGKTKAPYELIFISTEPVSVTASLKTNGKRKSLGKFDVTEDGARTFIAEDISSAFIIASWNGGSAYLKIEPSSCQTRNTYDIPRSNARNNFYDNQADTIACSDADGCDLKCTDNCGFTVMCSLGDSCTAECTGDCTLQCTGESCGQCSSSSCGCTGESCEFRSDCRDAGGCEIQTNQPVRSDFGVSCEGTFCYDVGAQFSSMGDGNYREQFTICSDLTGLCSLADDKKTILSTIMTDLQIPSELVPLTLTKSGQIPSDRVEISSLDNGQTIISVNSGLTPGGTFTISADGRIIANGQIESDGSFTTAITDTMEDAQIDKQNIVVIATLQGSLETLRTISSENQNQADSAQISAVQSISTLGRATTSGTDLTSGSGTDSVSETDRTDSTRYETPQLTQSQTRITTAQTQNR